MRHSRILYTSCFFSLRGGGQKSLYLFLKYLDKDKFLPFLCLPQEGEFSIEASKLGIKTLILPFSKARSLNVALTLSNILKLKDIVKGNQVDIIHVDSPRELFYARIVSKILKRKVIFHARTLDSTGWLDRKIYNFSDSIIAVADAVAQRFKGMGADNKVNVVYNAVVPEEFNINKNLRQAKEDLGINPEKIVIGLVARPDIIKGHEFFLRAARSVLDKLPQLKEKIHFLLIGSPIAGEGFPRKKKLEELISGLGLNGNVVFLDFRTDMADVYAAMDIVSLASFSEACPRVILEAMAAGRPVVATRVGGIPEIVSDPTSGFLVKAGDIADYSDKLTILIKDGKLAASMGAAGRRIAEEKFDIRDNVKAVEEIYSKLLLKNKNVKELY